MATIAASTPPKAPLLWLALGTFAIGTESFMISPLLPRLAGDLSVSVASAGQLVTVFALTYAFSSPILTTFTGSIDRRRLLVAAMAAFALANIVAFTARDYWSLMAARILLACAAGLYVPNANALAGALVAPDRRGTALAIVNGGTTIAITLGVPLGAIIGDRFGWRMTFAGVGILASVATIGLIVGLSRGVGTGLPVASLRERIAVVRQSSVLLALLATTLWATGAYAVYTYLALYLASVTGITGAHISLILFIWGLAAAAGLLVGGTLSDRFGARAVMVPGLLILTLAFASLSVIAGLVPSASALAPVLVTIIVWGVSAWAFFPAQQTRLIGIGGLQVAPIVLSLNASFMYLGFSLGALLGAFSLGKGPVGNLGWIGGLCEILALLLVLATTRRKRAKALSLPSCADA